MATNVRYMKSKNTWQERGASALQATFHNVGRVAKRIVRMLSFDATNIFKSKDWPYY